ARHAPAVGARGHLPGREVAAQEQGEGAQDPARAIARPRAPGAAGQHRRQPPRDGGQRRPLREDPYVQLPAEPHHRSSRQPDAAPARPRARRRPRPDHRRAGDEGAARGSRGRFVTVAAEDPGFAPAARSIGQALARAVARLRAAGVREPDADAQVLLAHTLGTTRAGLIAAARDPLPAGIARRVEEVLRRRERREPVAYIVGEREFWSLPMAVDRRVLVPRPETELLVEVAPP